MTNAAVEPPEVDARWIYITCRYLLYCRHTAWRRPRYCRRRWTPDGYTSPAAIYYTADTPHDDVRSSAAGGGRPMDIHHLPLSTILPTHRMATSAVVPPEVAKHREAVL